MSAAASGSDAKANGSADSRNHNQGSQDRKWTPQQKAEVIRIRKCSPTAFYEILAIQKTSSDGEIKKAYRKISLLTHPDKNGYEGADEAFKSKERHRLAECVADQYQWCRAHSRYYQTAIRSRGTISLEAILTIDFRAAVHQPPDPVHLAALQGLQAEGLCMKTRSLRRSYSTGFSAEEEWAPVFSLVSCLRSCRMHPFVDCNRWCRLRRPSICLQHGWRSRIHSTPYGRQQSESKA